MKDNHSLKDANDTLMEAIVTLDHMGISSARLTALWAIDIAVNSFVAKSLWNKKVSICTLPPDMDE